MSFSFVSKWQANTTPDKCVHDSDHTWLVTHTLYAEEIKICECRDCDVESMFVGNTLVGWRSRNE